MTNEDTIDSLTVVDEIIKTLEFRSTHYVVDNKFMPIFEENEINDMVTKLLCLRRRLAVDVEKINKLNKNKF